jgi:DNA repair exonuclease SbcCD ATPase subunit
LDISNPWDFYLRCAILESANVDIETLNEYKKLKEGLSVHGLSLKELHILLSILKTIREIGYEPQKIVRELSQIKTVRQTERQFTNSCKALESRLSGCREILPMCEQIMNFVI